MLVCITGLNLANSSIDHKLIHILFVIHRFYRIVYEENECYSASTVLERARARLGEKGYRPFSNNCEHFANECKTGEKKCHQIWTGIEILAKSASSKIPSFVREVCEKIFESSASVVRQPGIAEVAEEGFKLSTDLSIFIAAVIETVLLCKDYRVAKKKYDKGELTREEFCEVVVKRVCAGICSILLSSFGFLLGGMVPLPILGCFTSFLGGFLGDFLGKKAGGKLGDLLTPLFIEHLVRKKKIE